MGCYWMEGSFKCDTLEEPKSECFVCSNAPSASFDRRKSAISRLYLRRLIIDRHNQRLLLLHIIQSLHLLSLQLEVIDIGILSNTARIIALREWHPVLLQAVPDQHLSCRFTMLFSNGLQRWILGFLIPHERTVGFHYDTVVMAVVDDFSLLEPRVKLLCDV